MILMRLKKCVPSWTEKALKRHIMPFSPSSQNANNVKVVVQCSECKKWRVCYTDKVLKVEMKQQLEHELDNLTYSCGSYFHDFDSEEDRQHHL